MTGVFWGLLAALFIGTSDCIARVTTQRVSANILTLVIMLVSLASMTIGLALMGDWPRWHLAAWLASAASGSLNVAVLYFLYKALRRGPVAVASPAASVFTVLLVGMNALAGEPWSIWQLVSVVVVFLGIVMLARRSEAPGIDDQYDARWLQVTAGYGLVAAFCVALRMYLAQDASAAIGALSALYLNRVFGALAVSLVVGWMLISQRNIAWPRGSTLGLVLLQAMLETLALGSFLVGSAGTGRVAAAIGFSAFAAVTSIIAWLWLGERIGRRRAIWIAVVGGGVVLAILGSPASARA